MGGATSVAIVFIVVGMPVIGLIGLRAYWMWLRDKLLHRLLEERRLLIEKGVTDLPPLQLPETALAGESIAPTASPATAATRTRPRIGYAWVGLILLFVPGWLITFGQSGHRHRDDTLIFAGVALAVAGVLWLIVYGIVWASRRGSGWSYAAGAPQVAQPQPAERRPDPLSNMKAGIVLLFLAAGFVVSEQMTPASVPGAALQLHVAVFLAAIGLPLLVIQAIAALWERRQQPGQEDQSGTSQ